MLKSLRLGHRPECIVFTKTSITWNLSTKYVIAVNNLKILRLPFYLAYFIVRNFFAGRKFPAFFEKLNSTKSHVFCQPRYRKKKIHPERLNEFLEKTFNRQLSVVPLRTHTRFFFYIRQRYSL